MAGNEEGGLEKHTIELSNQLKEAGIETYVVAHPDFSKYFKNVNFIGLDLAKGRNNIFILYKLYKIFKKEKFDIIHTQANKATAMAVKLKPFFKSKLVATLHNYKNNLKAFKQADFVITVSDSIGKNLHITNKKTIYNGVLFDETKDLQIDLYSKYNIPKDKFIICSVARLTKVKRFDLLLKALSQIHNAHLILVGSGTEEKTLRELSIKLNISDKITFTRNLENKKVQNIIASSKLFVMTSDNEGFPYTFVETMFCKTPFLSTSVSDLEKIIGKKYIIPFGNVEMIIEKINYIQKNYNDVLQDYEKIFEFSKKKFTLQNMVQETINTYKELLK
jgi:glycosyltransferase involved in cell wall biosynthesis